MTNPPSLRQAIKTVTGQDVYRCHVCQHCDPKPDATMDVPLSAVIQMIMFDDDEVITCRTVWSDYVFSHASQACTQGLDLQSILLALRAKAKQRIKE